MEVMMIVMVAAMLAMGMNHDMMGMSEVIPGKSTATTNHPGETLFNNRCKNCHSLEQRKFGPAVIEMSHDRKVIIHTIANGRGLMPAFKKRLNEEEIQALSDYIALKQASE